MNRSCAKNPIRTARFWLLFGPGSSEAISIPNPSLSCTASVIDADVFSFTSEFEAPSTSDDTLRGALDSSVARLEAFCFDEGRKWRSGTLGADLTGCAGSSSSFAKTKIDVQSPSNTDYF